MLSSCWKLWRRRLPLSQHPENKCCGRPQQAVVLLSAWKLDAKLSCEPICFRESWFSNLVQVYWSVNILYEVLQVVVDVLIFNSLLWRKGPLRRKQKVFSSLVLLLNILSILRDLFSYNTKTFAFHWIVSFPFHVPDTSLLCDHCVGEFRKRVHHLQCK